MTGEYNGSETRTVSLSGVDKGGVKYLVSCKGASGGESASKRAKTAGEGESKGAEEGAEALDHFRSSHIDRFYANHNGRMGCAVLGFETGPGGVDAVYESYKAKHPALLLGAPSSYEGGEFKVVEVYAYYSGIGKTDVPDDGTVIRFVERSGKAAADDMVLPGINVLEASFDKWAVPAYFDHWVSNVVDRNQFLLTLEETLGFTPKVDFNAGVVAAGAAQIESTVTGNTPPAHVLEALTSKAEALVNQQQVYLPINNDLGKVGHVYLYLEEIGQGIQHIANRVEDLVSFIHRVNTLRNITGEGLAFLNIPRSYYGRLDAKNLVNDAIDHAAAEAIVAAMEEAGASDKVGTVPLDITDDAIVAAGAKIADAALKALFTANEQHIVKVMKTARYNNLETLLGEHLGDDTLLRIVQNKILVDIQGQDILYQIFTGNVMQRVTGEESPFLEFIQRVCSEKPGPDGKPRPLKPGCGGFGIRNFLTLFLSIEVSKAMLMLDTAIAAGDARKELKARKKIAIFTEQLEQSNPILTQISDAMTAEGEAGLERTVAGTDEARAALDAVIAEAQASKDEGGAKLKVLSASCKDAINTLDAEFADVTE